MGCYGTANRKVTRMRHLLLILLLVLSGCQSQPAPEPQTTATPVANAGTLTLGDQTYFLESLNLSAVKAGEERVAHLNITGEIVGPEPELLVFAVVPNEVVDTDGVKDIRKLKTPLNVLDKDPMGTWPPTIVYPKNGTKQAVTGGQIEVTSVTGEGPWEIDAEVTLKLESGDELSGNLKGKLTF